MKTNYSKAWDEFTESKEYDQLVLGLKGWRIYQPYIDSIIKNAFAAGWNATGKKIVILQPNSPTADKTK